MTLIRDGVEAKLTILPFNRLITLRAGATMVMGLALAPGNLSGQPGAFAFQVRGGATAALGAFGDETTGWEEEAGPGRSFGMGFTFPLFSVVGGYLGFSQHRFSCDEDVCPGRKSWVSTGFDVSLRVLLGGREIRPWFQGGLHTHRLEGQVYGALGPKSLHSEGGGGFEIGGGALIQMGERTSVSPGIRYGRGTVPFAMRPNMKLEYLVADLGLIVGF